MQIVLSILQFIGIALLVLLGIILVLILIILFYPICYTIEGEMYSEKNAKAKVSWLFHLIRARVVYEDDLISAKIGVFWKNIPFSYELKPKQEKENQEDIDIEMDIDIENGFNKQQVREDNNISDDLQSTELLSDADDRSKMQNETKIDHAESENDAEDIIVSNISENEKEDSTSDKEKISFIEKIKGMISKIKGTINKIKRLWSEIQTIITDEHNKSAVKHIKDETISLLKSFLPVKSKIDATFSIGSPDKTGQVFGLICAFPFIYKNEWSLRPDFATETAYFEGRFYAKGRIYLYKMVGMVLSILLDKNCRRLYKVIKQFINNLKEFNE